jgi:hypothetical protein
VNESFASVIAGISASTSPRKVGAAAEPVVGPLKIVLADCVARVAVSVPVVVIGDPETEKMFGKARATEVTVPPVAQSPEATTINPLESVLRHREFVTPLRRMSADWICLRLKAPVVPFGVARKRFAVCPVA